MATAKAVIADPLRLRAPPPCRVCSPATPPSALAQALAALTPSASMPFSRPSTGPSWRSDRSRASSSPRSSARSALRTLTRSGQISRRRTHPAAPPAAMSTACSRALHTCSPASLRERWLRRSSSSRPARSECMPLLLACTHGMAWHQHGAASLGTQLAPVAAVGGRPHLSQSLYLTPKP